MLESAESLDINMTKTNEQKDSPSIGTDLALALSVVAFLVSFSICWFSLDHHLPTTDEAGHILNSLAYGELYSHAHPFNLSWWKKMLTVSTFYPPSSYLLGGFLKLLLHQSRTADAALECIYYSILILSTYACARQVGLAKYGAAGSALIVGLYPGMTLMHHAFMLDLPLASMVAFGIAVLFFWAKDPNPRRSILVGIVLGIACLTKQLVGCYLAPPALLLFLTLLKTYKLSKTLVASALLACAVACIVTPWTVTNLDTTIGLANYNKECMALSKNVVQSSFIDNVSFYIQSLVRNCSLPLFIFFVASFCTTSKKWHLQLLPLTTSGIFGILILSSCTWCELVDRYTIAALLPIAIYTGLGAQNLLHPGSPRAAAIAAALTVLAIAQFTALNFSPYPINFLLPEISTNLTHLPKWCRSKNDCPIARDQWGTEEAITFIDQYEKNAPAWVNILANQAELNAHSFQLIATEKHSSMRPTTSLQWTLAGDKLDFSPQTALNFQWYLIRSGASGYKFITPQSETNYNKLKEFIAKSGHYKMVWSHELPDSETLYLYRQQKQVSSK